MNKKEKLYIYMERIEELRTDLEESIVILHGRRINSADLFEYTRLNKVIISGALEAQDLVIFEFETLLANVSSDDITDYMGLEKDYFAKKAVRMKRAKKKAGLTYFACMKINGYRVGSKVFKDGLRYLNRVFPSKPAWTKENIFNDAYYARKRQRQLRRADNEE